MKPNQKNRYNTRHRNMGYRPQTITRNTALDSTGPAGKLHGTALQLFEKYQACAKDALIQNDTVLAETYLQFADHYARLQNMAIANEENNRAQNTQRSIRPATNQNTPSNTSDELPDFGVPVENGDVSSNEVTGNDSDELTEEDKAIKNMDLSIPILAIQEKHTAGVQKPQTKQRRTYMRRKKTENAAA